MHSQWMLLLVACLLPLCGGRKSSGAEADLPLVDQLPEMHGLCVQLGANVDTTLQILQSPDVLVHMLDSQVAELDRLQHRIDEKYPDAPIVVEHWTARTLPHAENIANFIVVEDAGLLAPEEMERVLAPGGVGLVRDGRGYAKFTKLQGAETDEWTHQWHDVDGGLTTADQQVGIPRGIQWLAGPLFAMAGRKSSTQTLVSSGGLNFYITQNVLENVGLATDEMKQYLVARDAYNGLVRWQRDWTGPFVTGNGETNPRMVATGGRLYATDGGTTGHHGLICLDPKTGSTISKIELAAPPAKILVHNGQVLIQSSNGLKTFDRDLKHHVWSFAGERLSGAVINADRCFLLASGRSEDGRFRHDLVCLDLASGRTEWRENSQPHVETPRVRINFAADGFVALQAHGSLHLFSALDGHHLWSRETDARPGKAYVDERYVGHFYRHGLVWMLAENSPREPSGQNLWLGLNPSNGEVERTLKTTGSWPRTDTPAKMGCQVLIASDRYIMIPRQATFVDFETGAKTSFKFTRGGCGLGFVPANGLVYSHPHACGCFSDTLRGFMGMHSHSSEILLQRNADRAKEGRLTSFFRPPALEEQNHPNSDDWPIHRGNVARSGHSSTRIERYADLEWSKTIAEQADSISGRSWSLRTGNLITAPTIAQRTAFVAEVDKGRLHALDIANGQSKWTFTASGRIDSPPTAYRGLCLFGAHDGYVYCLDAKTGKLAWKFRAAPVERRIVAFGSVESAWPVAGSVLIQNDVAFVAAGRAPDADAGIEVHAIHPVSGQLLWSSRVEATTFRGIADYLVGGQDGVYLGNQRFDEQTGEQVDTSSNSRHLRGGKVGLLEASWTKHDLALRKDIQTWTAEDISGQLLAFSPSASAAYSAEAAQVLLSGDEHEHLPIAAPRQVTGMAITDELLVVAGGVDRGDALRSGFLQVVDLASGDVTREAALTAEAVFDGVALANRQIFVSTQDGRLSCFSTSSDP